MKPTHKISTLAALLLLGSLVLSACGAGTPEATPTPTISLDAIRTSAVGTFSAGLTQTAIAMPTATSTNTPVPTATTAPTTAGVTSVPTSSCYGLTAVKDVTIPDNTSMTSGQTFTKTWRVRNSGTCAWDVGFSLVFAGGEAMGGTSFVLTAPVAAGAEVELSIPMSAPAKTGTLRGDWRMATAGGAPFGDYLWVIIVVGTAPTSTVTPTATATNTP